MNSAELYDNVLAALHEDEGTFNAAVRNWIEGAEEPHFDDEEANELYARAKHHCVVWRSNAINSRYAKRQMVDCVRQIAEKGLHNPYKEIEAGFRMLGVVPDETKLVDEPEAIQGSTLPNEETKKDEAAEKPVRVLGVVPEEKPGLFKRKKR